MSTRLAPGLRPRDRSRRSPVALALPAILIALIVNLPLAYLVLRATDQQRDGYLSIALSRDTLLLVAETLVVGGFPALTLNFRGYGESEGSRDIELIDRDVEAAIDYLVAAVNMD